MSRHHGHQGGFPYARGANLPARYFPAPCSSYEEEEAKKHKLREHMAEAASAVAWSAALHETYEAMVDPQHAGRHKMKAEIALTEAVRAEVYAVYEHHESNKYQSHHRGHHNGHCPHHHGHHNGH